MDTIQQELAELKSFIADLKADRAAQKEKEKREAWTKYTSMSLVLLAVLAAVATQWGGKCSSRTLVHLNDATFNQAKASDQWSYYQAKSIKQNLFEMNRDQLVPPNGTGADAALTGQLEKIDSKIEKYKKDKDDIQKQAEALEKKRDEARMAADQSSHQGGQMGLAVSIYQIAIAMGSICLVVKKKSLWYLSLMFAVLATAQLVYAFIAH
jgi:uncharacterized membrane protein YoaK (UPF0700 family)